ncbi:hypothetical protein OG21DRAFT_1517729 [Imleria badia]|nr:hypothetical protein OG21DRAFT_1517729 [Imleria badia]
MPDLSIRSGSVFALRISLSVFGFFSNSDRFFAWDGSEMEDILLANNFGYLWCSIFL